VLDRLFLLRVLDRMPRPVANLITFAIVVVGWTIFRAHSMDQAIAFLHAMMHLGPPRDVTDVSINPDVMFIAVLAAVVCALP
jgi:alginate O-acetyltransferase complex protein AlgI